MNVRHTIIHAWRQLPAIKQTIGKEDAMNELHLQKNVKRAIVLTAILLLFAWWCMETNLVTSTVWKNVLTLCRHMIHISLAAVWCYTLQIRIPDAYLRRYLTAAGGLITFFLFVRMIKWEFLPMGDAGRMMWYLYYIPMILLPCLGVPVVLAIGQGESDPVTCRHRRWIFLPAGILILLVLTNDLHSMVFRFPEGLALYDNIYSYGWLYFVIMAWIYGLGLYFVLSLMVRSRVPGSRFARSYPAVIMGVAILFWFLNSLRVLNVDFVAVSCILVVLLLETTIQVGLIPSNTGYRNTFRYYMDQVWIADRKHRIRYASKNAKAQTGSLSEALMIRAESGPFVIEDMQLNAKPIAGGHVYWMTDISEVQKAIRQLADAEKRLQENNDLLRAEAALKEKDIQLAEQKKIFDRIEEGTSEALAELDILRKKAEAVRQENSDVRKATSENTRQILPDARRSADIEQQESSDSLPDIMKKICFLGAFIKRYSNLLLLSEPGKIPLKELELALRESLEYLKLSVPVTELAAGSEGEAQAEAICGIYLLFTRLLYWNISTLEAVYVTLSGNSEEIRISMEIGLSGMCAWQEIPTDAFAKLGGKIDIQRRERGAHIDLCISGQVTTDEQHSLPREEADMSEGNNSLPREEADMSEGNNSLPKGGVADE